MDIIIPTKNDEQTLRDCLRSLRKQTIPCRIIIVDGNSTDKTLEIAKEYDCEIYDEPITTNVRKSAEARNLGLKHSNSPLVVFVDADSIVPPTWTEDLSKYLWNEDVDKEGKELISSSIAGVTSGCEYHGKTDLSYAIYRVMQIGSHHSRKFSNITQLDSLPTYNAIYRRKILDSVNINLDQIAYPIRSKNVRPQIFDETLGGCEDWELNYRLRKRGWKLIGVSCSPAEHRERPTLKSFAKQMFHYAWARARVTKLKKIFSPLYALPSLALLSLIFMLWFLPREWTVLSLLGYCVFGAVISVRLLWGKKYTLKQGWYIFPILVIQHISWALGYLWGLLS